jgi:thiamine kinase-like enzyme
MAANSMPQVAGIRVPTIVSILPEKKAILTEKRAWQDSSSELRRFFVRSLKIDWERVGLWLRNYHDSKISLSKNEYFIRKKLQKIQTHLEKLRLLFTGEQQEKMNMIIRSAQDYLNTHACEWVISHGDFSLDNIKISDSTMDIIDFEDSQMAPRDFDVLNFLTRLEYVSYFPHKPGAYDKICRQFQDGYGMYLPHTPVFDFFYSFVKLDMIETYFRRRNEKNCEIHKKLIYLIFERKGKNRLVKFLEKNF